LFHGTNTASLMSVPATGKQVATTSMDITRMANGKSVEHWLQLDMLGILQQMGVVLMPGQGGA
jgi:predicted ester cyclase